MTGPNYGRTFAQMREGCTPSWQAYTRHAFVQGLGDGTLPRAAFLHYLVQDYVYLVNYARAWSLGVVKAETLDEMKHCAATVDVLVNQEMALHVQVCAAEGISEQQLFDASEEIENIAYTRYVLDAGMQGDFLDLIAALAPCIFGYGEIGLKLAQTAGADAPYADWINTYASPDFQTACTSAGAMLDGAVTRRLGDDPTGSPRWAVLQDRFTTATQLEIKFWDMGLRGGSQGA